MEVKLFVYGMLRPGEPHSPETTTAVVSDLASIGNNQMQGFTLTIDDSELPALDQFESPEYKRVKVVTSKGFHAWAYELIEKESL